LVRRRASGENARVVWWLVLGANVATFLLFGFDKWRARRERRRVPESTLLWATFACGCVGAWVGMRLFRHKTQKVSFRRWAVLVTLLNPLWLLVWMEFRG
jgi:uncharacterized membrane protein YsdA (DUF1294 family)